MSFDVGAFGWHATVFVTWGSVAVFAAIVIAVAVIAKLLVIRAG